MRPGSKESKELLLGRMVILNVACDLRSLRGCQAHLTSRRPGGRSVLRQSVAFDASRFRAVGAFPRKNVGRTRLLKCPPPPLAAARVDLDRPSDPTNAGGEEDGDFLVDRPLAGEKRRRAWLAHSLQQEAGSCDCVQIRAQGSVVIACTAHTLWIRGAPEPLTKVPADRQSRATVGVSQRGCIGHQEARMADHENEPSIGPQNSVDGCECSLEVRDVHKPKLTRHAVEAPGCKRP